MKIISKLTCVLLVTFLFSVIKVIAQEEVIDYISKTKNDTGWIIRNKFSIKHKNDNYTIIFPSDTSIISYTNKNRYDTIISNQSLGPYQFRKINNLIKVGFLVNKKWKFEKFYLLKKDTVVLKPDILASSINSYTIVCRYLDEGNNLELAGKFFSYYRFLEVKDADRNYSYQIIFIDSKSFLPIKMISYSDSSLYYPNYIIERK